MKVSPCFKKSNPSWRPALRLHSKVTSNTIHAILLILSQLEIFPNKVFIINTISSWLPHVLDHKSSSPSPGHYNPALSVAGHASRAQYVTTWKVTISYSLKTPIRYDTLPLGTWAPGQCWAAAAGGARGAALGRRETVRKAAAGPRPIFFQRHKHLEGRSCPGTVRTRWGWQPGWTTLQLGKVARVECQHTLVQVNTCRAMPIPCFWFIWTYSSSVGHVYAFVTCLFKGWSRLCTCFFNNLSSFLSFSYYIKKILCIQSFTHNYWHVNNLS